MTSELTITILKTLIIIQLAHLKGKKITLYFLFYSPLFTISSIYYRKLIFRHPILSSTLGFATLGPKLFNIPKPTPTNVLFKLLIKTYIKLACKHPASFKNDFNRFFKSQNPDLYYGKSYITYYYFC